jgi:hypothetical protein
VEALGTLTVIGQGNLEQARDFDRTHGKGLPALVDSKRRSYRVLGLTRGVTSTLGPASMLKGIRSVSRGFMQGTTQGDSFQQGGVLVLKRGGRPRYIYRSQFAGDHPAVETIVQEMEAAVSPRA